MSHTEHDHGHHQHMPSCCAGHGKQDAGKTHLAKDPVCGMSVDPASAKHKAVHQGETFHFCSPGCKTKFEADPQRYLAPKTETPPADPAAIYTCPMHPEIRQVGPAPARSAAWRSSPKSPPSTAAPIPNSPT